jgi:hypothetical protein
VNSTLTIPDEALSQNNGGFIPFSLFSNATLEECDGLSGPFTLNLDGSLANGSTSFTATVNARLSGFDAQAGNCLYVFDDFLILGDDIASDGSGSARSSGRLDAQCDAGSASCDFLNIDPNNSDAINNSCSFL